MPTCAIISLGCPKNLVDSEQMLGILRHHSLSTVYDVEEAEVVIINTCGFLAASREEGMENIREMEALRADPRHPLRCLIVAGCLVSRDKTALVQECAHVDAFLDVFSREAVLEVVKNCFPGVNFENPAEILPEKTEPALRLITDLNPGIAKDEFRFPLLPPHVAYLKIAEGCNRRCAFCAIPNIRGNYVSKPMPEVLKEARLLVESGVREIVLIAQDTSFYGRDLRDGTSLAGLVRNLENIENLRWVRILYLYPQNFDDDLIDAIAESSKVVPYLDMPLQHINNRILSSMRRLVSREETIALLARLRERIPGLALRTGFIVGYPGETDAEFEELLAFLRKQKFERVGVFQYSPEEGTPAAEMPHQVAEKVSAKRASTLMKIQRKISQEWLRSFVGQEVEVLVDAELGPNDDYDFIGRTKFDAPDIDGHVFISAIQAETPMVPGKFYTCRIVDCDEYDLIATFQS